MKGLPHWEHAASDGRSRSSPSEPADDDRVSGGDRLRRFSDDARRAGADISGGSVAGDVPTRAWSLSPGVRRSLNSGTSTRPSAGSTNNNRSRAKGT